MNKEQLEQAMTNLAQGAINITEGLTTIEQDSRIHNAMLVLVEAHVKGEIEVRGERTALDHLTDAKVSIDLASSAICSVKSNSVSLIWRQLGLLTDKLLDLRGQLDYALHELAIKATQTDLKLKRSRKTKGASL